MKKILVSGYIGFNNFGDEAIFYALSDYLKRNNMLVSVLCNNKKEVKQKYQVKAYNYKKPLQILKAIFNCDILISGGGSLLQNKTSNLSLFYYLFIIFLAKIFFKKVIIFAQGIEPINGFFQTQLTKFILKTCNYITVRDENSLNYLKKLNIKAQLVSDPVYSIIQDKKISQNKQGLVVQLRNHKGLNDNLLDLLAQNISKTYQDNNIKVLSLQDEFDKNICLKFIEKLNKYNKSAELISNLNIDETIDLLNNAKYVISTRLHGLIAASGLQTKTFALIYDDKVNSLAQELNLENIEINNYKEENLFKKIDDFFNNNQNEPHYNYRHFSWEYFDYILK